ncbi:hypothetical protein CW304_13680 [Bacillus sp. UFRGS-B20]|nr:hypothetical protein CW304_13680 [Bacillus sp. UFRGS-B20]
MTSIADCFFRYFYFFSRFKTVLYSKQTQSILSHSLQILNILSSHNNASSPTFNAGEHLITVNKRTIYEHYLFFGYAKNNVTFFN